MAQRFQRLNAFLNSRHQNLMERRAAISSLRVKVRDFFTNSAARSWSPNFNGSLSADSLRRGKFADLLALVHHLRTGPRTLEGALKSKEIC
jgi:hypothetical protein